MARSQEVLKKVENLPGLPALPRVVRHLKELVNHPPIDLRRLERAIGSDPAMTAKILRYANSAMYGFPGRVAALYHALILLGINMIRGLITSTPPLDELGDVAEELRRHSLGVSLMAGAIAERAHLPEPHVVSQAGLLHDLGKLLILTQFPRQYIKIDKLMEREDIYGFEAEAIILGVDHSTLAATVCRAWNLPPQVGEPIAHHHAPEEARQAVEYTAAVHLADILVKGMGLTFRGDVFVPPLSPAAWKSLGLSLPDMEGLIRDGIDSLKDIELLDPFK